MKLTLTYFKQVTPDWDNILGLGNYADADPNISFDIEFIDIYNNKPSKKNRRFTKKTGHWIMERTGRLHHYSTRKHRKNPHISQHH